MANNLYFKIILLITTFNLSTSICAQNITKQLRVIRGGNIPFVISTMKEYSNGKSLGDTASAYTNGWTRLHISFTDTTDGGNNGSSIGWDLLVNASNLFTSDMGNNELSLDSLKVFAKAGSFTNSTVTTYNKTLGIGETIIASGTDPLDQTARGEIGLSFYLFMRLGKQPDYYCTDLIITLRQK